MSTFTCLLDRGLKHATMTIKTNGKTSWIAAKTIACPVVTLYGAAMTTWLIGRDECQRLLAYCHPLHHYLPGFHALSNALAHINLSLTKLVGLLQVQPDLRRHSKIAC